MLLKKRMIIGKRKLSLMFTTFVDPFGAINPVYVSRTLLTYTAPTKLMPTAVLSQIESNHFQPNLYQIDYSLYRIITGPQSC